jgi:osmoprotectant transport system ATP-binding protein
LFVTHDVREAMYLGTKMIIMDAGIVQQYATPEEIRENPATEYVEAIISRTSGDSY